MVFYDVKSQISGFIFYSKILVQDKQKRKLFLYKMHIENLVQDDIITLQGQTKQLTTNQTI